MLPVVYQTNDDPHTTLILQGDKTLEIAPNAHVQTVHYFIGRIVSSLSVGFPHVAWYGLLMASFYILAFTVIGWKLPGIKCRSSVGRGIGIFLVFVVAYALLPLLLFQFTIVAGLLALAGMLPCVRYVCLRESCSLGMWGIAALCLLFGFMYRFWMAGLVMATCLPLLGLAFFYDRDRRRAGLCALYLFVMGALGLGLYHLDHYTYRTSPANARLLKYHSLRREYTDGVKYNLLPLKASHRMSKESRTAMSKHTSQPAEYAGIGLSPNDYEMLTGFMGIDSGPFSLQNLQRSQDIMYGEDEAANTAQKSTRNAHVTRTKTNDQGGGSTREKLRGMIQGQNVRHIRLTLYLMVIFGAGGTLIVGGTVLRDWKSVSFLGIIACTVAASCAYVAIVLDRAVFRVLFPCAYVFLIMAIVFFPWDRLRTSHELSIYRRWLLLSTIGIFCFIGGVGMVMGGTQIQRNRDNKLLYSEMIKKIRMKIGAQRVFVAWPSALPVEYQSPFERRDASALKIYPMGAYTSNPALLNRLKQLFGEDVYEGLTKLEVVHLFRDPGNFEILKRFYAEHYGRQFKGIRIGEFLNGEGETTAWVLVDAEDP